MGLLVCGAPELRNRAGIVAACLVSSSPSSTPGRATAAGRSRPTRGPCRASWSGRSSPGSATCWSTARGRAAPTPACTPWPRWPTSIWCGRRRSSSCGAGINDELPADVHVLDAAAVSRKFHARHSAVRRSYVYQVSRRRSAFAKPYVWWVKDPIDLGRMQAVAAGFVGRHDFQAFSDDDPDEKSTLVELDEVTRHRGRPAAAGPRRRLALPVEDGAPHGRRAGGGRHRRAAAGPHRRLARRSDARRAAASRRGSPPRRPDCSWSGSSTRAIAGPSRCARQWRALAASDRPERRRAHRRRCRPAPRGARAPCASTPRQLHGQAPR